MNNPMHTTSSRVPFPLLLSQRGPEDLRRTSHLVAPSPTMSLKPKPNQKTLRNTQQPPKRMSLHNLDELGGADPQQGGQSTFKPGREQQVSSPQKRPPNSLITGDNSSLRESDCEGTPNASATLRKFFQYIVEYKMGKVESYQAEEAQPIKKILKVRESHTNNRFSEPVGFSQSSCSRVAVHYGYFCDECDTCQPIRGTRYSCQTCEDFDLCQGCFDRLGHPHVMKQLRRCQTYDKHEESLKRMSCRVSQAPQSCTYEEIGQRVSLLETRLLSNSLRY